MSTTCLHTKEVGLIGKMYKQVLMKNLKHQTESTKCVKNVSAPQGFEPAPNRTLAKQADQYRTAPCKTKRFSINDMLIDQYT